ncbi:MAG: hypothetical protein M3137_08635 [Actinomycetota bacterium]|nr:hypothetical protein [Actinomycetota bacterium]
MFRFRQSREARFANPNIPLMAGLGLGVLVPVVLFLVEGALGDANGLLKFAVGILVSQIIFVPTSILLLTRRRR